MTDQDQTPAIVADRHLPESIWVAGTPQEYGEYFSSAVEAEDAWGGVGVEFIRKDPLKLKHLDAAATIAACAARIVELEAAADKLLLIADSLRGLASYAEIVGGISVNGPQIRKECDRLLAFRNELPEDENFEPTFSVRADPALKGIE